MSKPKTHVKLSANMLIRFIKSFLIAAAILVSFLQGCQQSSQQKSTPLNILWIVSDDLGVDLGCYGNTAVATPHLNQFAGESVRYTNFFTSTPVCSPSRSGLITGMYPVSIDCHQHRTSYKKPLPDGVEPITSYFREAGYFVTNGNTTVDGRGKTDYNFQHKSEDMFDGVDYRARTEGQPFFSQIQIFLPHRPFKQDESRPVDPGSVDIPPYYPDHPVTRKDWALYLETIQHVDKAFGQIMERLREDGVLENTVIFFVGDQGRPHLRAKQFLYDAGTHTPLMVRWPDGKGAGTVSNALVSNIDLSAASLALAGIEIPHHIQGVNFLDGTTERDHVFTAKDRMDGTIDRQRAIRSRDFKYIKNYYPERAYTQFNTYKKTSYPVLTLMEVMEEKGELNKDQLPFMADTRPGEELYDLNNDPYELNNLADHDDYREVLSAMRNTLAGYVEKYDKGRYPENEEELTRARETMMEAYTRKMKKMGLSTEVPNETYLEYWEKELLKEETKTR